MFARPGLCGMGIGRLGLMSASQVTLLQQAIAAIRRNNGTLFYVPQNALGDGAPNLLSAPEDFSDAAWVKDPGGAITANTDVAPDDTLTADTLTITAGQALRRAISKPAVDAAYTGSTWVVRKSGGGDFAIRFVANGSVIAGSTVLPTLPLGVWTRVTTTANSGAFADLRFDFPSSVAGTYAIWGAKLEQGSTATAYTPQSVLSNRGVFIDSAGVSPVTNIADVIGRMTDRSYGGAVGDELVTNGAWTRSGTGVTVSGNTVTFTPSLLSDSCQNTGLVVSGKAYTARLTVSGYSGGGVSFMVAGNSIGSVYSANGTYSQVIVPGASGAIGVRAIGLKTNAVVSSISVREIIGNHATQATTANKPTVQINAQGRYVMRFDGSNDSLATNITTGNEGWVCAGVTFGAADNADETVFSSGASISTAKGVWLLRSGPVSTNAWSVIVGNGAGRQLSRQSEVALKTGPVVVEGGWKASSITSAVNGIDGTPSSRNGDATPPPHAAFIGAGTGHAAFFNGPMTAQVICPVLPSAADRAIIRKWIGSLQGQVL